MRIYRGLIMLVVCAALCRAQAANSDQALLQQARDKYDAPFSRNLASFDCAIDFSWKQHFMETTRLGDEGTDAELQNIFQPIRTRVTVTRDRVTAYANLSEDEINKLPHGGMAELLLEHAVQKSLETWLPASTNSILPAPASPVFFAQSAAGYTLVFKMQDAEIDMALAPDMRLQGASLKDSPSDHFETSFVPGPQGFLLASWALDEDGNPAPGNRLIFTYTYQTVDGIQVPEHVVINRQSHHEMWRYALSGCIVKTSK